MLPLDVGVKNLKVFLTGLESFGLYSNGIY